MKKTLIALMALAGVTFAEDWTAKFSTSDKTITQSYDDYSAVFEGSSDIQLSLAFDSLTITATGNQANGEYNGTALGGAYSNAIRPNANIGAGASWTLTFTLTNASDEDISINAITLDTFLYNKSGNDQSGGAGPHTINYSLTAGASSASVNAFEYTNANWDNSNPTLTFDTPIVLSASDGKDGGLDEVSFTLMVSEAASAGTFVGLTGATFSGQVVPEPTTATLSLLALAGLAARRRRASR